MPVYKSTAQIVGVSCIMSQMKKYNDNGNRTNGAKVVEKLMYFPLSESMAQRPRTYHHVKSDR